MGANTMRRKLAWLAAGAALLVTHTAYTQTAKPDWENFDRIPDGIVRQMTDSTKSVGYPSLAWSTTNGSAKTVTVAFNGGTEQARKLIELTANDWVAGGGRVNLSFRSASGAWRVWGLSDATPKANIRIGFFTDPARRGYWSAVGTLAERINPNAPTMNFGALGTSLQQFDPVSYPKQWNDSYARSVILHEFGHAFSLNHEHFHPKCQMDLKLQETIASLMKPPNNWKESQARFNMDANYYFQAMAGQVGGTGPVMTADSDRASVMLYSFNNSFYKSASTSPCRPSGALGYATSLSPGDRAYYAQLYGTGG
jgi:hypothetical protein